MKSAVLVRGASVTAAVIACVAMGACAAVPAPVLNAGVNAATSEGSLFSSSVQSTYAVPLEVLRAAAIDAGESLEYAVKKHSESGSSCTYYFVPRRGDSIRIVIVQHTPVVATIRIRVGLLGDQSLSRFVLAEIEKRLRASAP